MEIFHILVYVCGMQTIKGRGAQLNNQNRFQKNSLQIFFDDVKEPQELKALASPQKATKYIEVFPKSILNKVKSPDIPQEMSMNPYQGCEHGCIYCYARNTHDYWDFSSGIAFEQNILYKKNTAALLEKKFLTKSYHAASVLLSGNTDCYQPIERKLKITRETIKLFWAYRHPLSIITKNNLIERDLDILQLMAKNNLVHVIVSLTTLNQDLKSVMEPRTASVRNALRCIENLSQNNIPVMVMMAPVIPGINDHEMLNLAEAASSAGARAFSYSLVRLNGNLGDLFQDWIEKQFPLKAKGVMNKIRSLHNGKLNDNRFHVRMRGEGNIAEMVKQQYQIAKKKYFGTNRLPPLDFSQFEIYQTRQLKLF